MPRYASGKFAQRISDRSGMAFPYNEMVQEWNDLTIIYETDNKGKHAAFEYQAGEVKIVEKLNPNILDRILESLPF